MSREDSKQNYRYNLAMLHPESETVTNYGIEISEDIPYITDRKSLLSEIDLFTMQTVDVNDLEFHFLTIEELDEDATFYIVYKSTKKEKDDKGNIKTTCIDKKAPILYKEDSEEMLPFAEELSTTVKTNTDHFYKFLKMVLDKKQEWLDWMKEHRYLTTNLYDKLCRMKDGYDSFLENQISDALSSYKVIRDIYIGNKIYEKRFEIEEPLSNGDVDLTPGDVLKRLEEAYDAMTVEPVEDEAYKDYADEDWHR